MSKSVSGIRAVYTLGAADQRGERITPAQDGGEVDATPNKRSAKERFLENLGLPALPTLPRTSHLPARRPTATLLPLKPATASAISSQPIADELAKLYSHVLDRLGKLPANESAQHYRFLKNVSLCPDPVGQVLLFKVLDASITTATTRLKIGEATALGSPLSMWDHLARTSTLEQTLQSISSLPGLGSVSPRDVSDHDHDPDSN